MKNLIIACLAFALSACTGDWLTGPIDWSIPPTPSANVMAPTTGVVIGGIANMVSDPGDTLTLSVVLTTRSNKKAITNAPVEWRVVDPRGQGNEGLAYFVTTSTRTNAAGIATTRLVIVGHFVELQAIARATDAPDITFSLRPTYLY